MRTLWRLVVNKKERLLDLTIQVAMIPLQRGVSARVCECRNAKMLEAYLVLMILRAKTMRTCLGRSVLICFRLLIHRNGFGDVVFLVKFGSASHLKMRVQINVARVFGEMGMVASASVRQSMGGLFVFTMQDKAGLSTD